jgi:hypothetical protein
VADVAVPDRWYSIAMQKSAGSNRVRVYLDGVLRINENVGAALSTLDFLNLFPDGSDGVDFRQLSVRTNAVLPEIHFTAASPVTFADLFDPSARWNSYMLG